jgi:predicted nucleotidyltransferase
MENIVLARITHGSTLFGLSTPKSDMDYVSVVLPSAARILLSEGYFVTDVGSTSDSTRKNTSADVDDKQFSLATFLELCASGTLDSIELLNAPLEYHVIEPHPLFLELIANKDRLVSRNFDKIVGFCSNQAVTYSPRKERYLAAMAARNALLALGVTETTKTLAGEYFDRVVEACATDYVVVKSIPNPNGRDMLHLNICGKMVPESVHASQALIVAASASKRYGKRVKDVANATTDDWKSLSHALRIAYEGIEYMQTGAVTLPVPNRAHLLDVKLGRFSLEQVAEEVDEAVKTLIDEAKKSTLPETHDSQFVREFVISAHGRRVVADFEDLEEELETVRDLKLSGDAAMLGPSKLTIR